MVVLVENPMGQYFGYDIVLTNNVFHLKEAILETTGMPIEHQCLVYKGRVLEDAEILASCQTSDDDVIQLMQKELLLGETGLPPDDQHLTFGDQVVSDDPGLLVLDSLRIESCSIPIHLYGLGVSRKAYAVVLSDWDGQLLDPTIRTLPLSYSKVVIVTDILNKDWFRGYNFEDNRQSDYEFPRNHVKIFRVLEEGFRKQLLELGESSLPPGTPFHRPVTSRHAQEEPLTRWKAIIRHLNPFNTREKRGIQTWVSHRESQSDREDTDQSILDAAAAALPPKGDGAQITLPAYPYPSTDDLYFDMPIADRGRSRILATLRAYIPTDGDPTVDIVLTFAPSSSSSRTRFASATITFRFKGNEVREVITPTPEVSQHTMLVEKRTQTDGHGDVEVSGKIIKIGAGGNRTKEIKESVEVDTRPLIQGFKLGQDQARWTMDEERGQERGIPTVVNVKLTLRVKPRASDIVCEWDVIPVPGRRKVGKTPKTEPPYGRN